MNKKPLATIFLALTCITLTFLAPIFDTSIYAIDGHPTNWMSFMPSSPFRNQGLSFLTSPFIHLGFEHLAMNLFFFIPIAMMIERKKSASFLTIIFIAIHLQVLIGLILINYFYALEAKAFLGCSHIVIGLYVFWFLKNKRYGLFYMTLALLGIGLWQSQSPLTVLVHVLGLIIGVITLFFGHFLGILGSKRTN